MRTAPLPPRLGLGMAALVALSACGSEVSGVPSTAPGASDRAAEEDPRLAEARALLEQGLPEAAGTLLDQLGASGGAAGALLRGRASLLRGDAVGALRCVEEARALAPGDGRVLATEVEVLVVLDRLEAARDALREAYKAVGKTAALERARGLCLLRTPGGAREGLAALEQAVALDPELDFVAFPLAQAHLLVGRQDVSDGAPERALVHAASVRRLDPGNVDATELEAEAYAALGDFERAIERYAALEDAGRELGATRALLAQRLGTRLLLERRRDEALEAYATARRLGLDDEGLGFGAHLLAEEADARVDEGIERFEAGDFAGAAERFRAALALAPEHLEARNHLGAALFKEGDFAGAASAWREVLAAARRDGVALPAPVHLDLARAHRLAGDADAARAALSAYLDAHPDGEWAGETRELLARLEAEALLDAGR